MQLELNEESPLNGQHNGQQELEDENLAKKMQLELNEKEYELKKQQNGQQELEDENVAKIESLKEIQGLGIKTLSALIAQDPIKTDFLLPEINKILNENSKPKSILTWIISYIFGDSKEKDFNDGLTKMIEELEDKTKKFQNQVKQSRESVSQSKGFGG